MRVRGGVRLASLAGVAVVLALAGCGEDPAPVKTVPAEDVIEDTEADAVDPGSDGIADTVADTDTANVPDVCVGAKCPDAKDVGTDVVSTGCVSDQQCVSVLLGLKACQEARCELATGVCKPAMKAGSCCDDTDCNDTNKCTGPDKCDPATSKCIFPIIAACCDTQLTLLKTGFEQNAVEGFQFAPDPAKQVPYLNGNVKWQLETHRAHNGKTSLYLGNECYSYDTSMTTASGCASSGGGAPITTSLKFPELLIPKDDKGNLPHAVLDFWLYLDAEPSYTGGPNPLPKGNCAKACDVGFTCVDLGPPPDGAGSQCLPEKDLLTLKIDGMIEWDSTKIGKTTDGKWHHIAVDLAGKGSAPQISLDFTTTSGSKNNFEGVYIDDVTVQTLCVGDPATKDQILCNAGTPCADDKKACTSEDCTVFANQSGSGLCYYDKAPTCCQGVADCDDANSCTVDTCSLAAGGAGTCKSVPDVANNQCCVPSNLFKDDFTSGNLSAWTQQDGNSAVVNWKLNPSCQTGSCMYFGNSAFTSYDDPSIKPIGPKESRCSKPIALQQGTLYNVLTFNLKMDSEWTGQPKDKFKNPPVADTPKVDELTVFVKPSGLPVTMWSSDSIQGTTEGKYVPVTVALDKFAGKTVQVCFKFDAGDSTGNTKAGIFVDDVKVDVACQLASACVLADCAVQCTGACETPSCTTGQCACVKTAGCCKADGDCDDKDTCTTDKCNAGACANTATSPTCCSPKTPFTEAFEDAAGKTPTAWSLKPKTGNGQSGPYDQNVKWNISPLKASGASTYSLYFGNNGTYNAGSNVPAGDARTPNVTIPANGTTIVTFDLYLSTEWDGQSFQDPSKLGLIVDRLRVGLVDSAAVAPITTAWPWSSYSIGGTTNGKWQSVVFAVPENWKGKTAQLDFEFDAGTPNNNNHEGVYLDNVQVQTLCTKPACIDDNECVPAGGADVCKKYYCAKDSSSGAFGCKNDFQPGAGCCQSTNALPSATFESGQPDLNWDLSTANTCPDVKWQVIPKKKHSGQYELYFGNPKAFNYDCTGLNGGVGGEVCSKPFKLSADVKKGANLSFKGWFGIEAAFELFQITVKYQGANGPATDTVFDKNGTEPKTSLLKPAAGQKCGGEYCTPVTKTADLSKYKNLDLIVVCFNFDSGDNLSNSKYEGIYLDDILVSEPCL